MKRKEIKNLNELTEKSNQSYRVYTLLPTDISASIFQVPLDAMKSMI